MVSPGSYIRSAARATFSAYRTVPVRWRLAGGSAALTFIILAGFAAMVGFVTTNQLRGQFNDQVDAAADQLSTQIRPLAWLSDGSLDCNKNVSLSDFVATEHAQIRIFSDTGTPICTQDQVRIKGQHPRRSDRTSPRPDRPGSPRRSATGSSCRARCTHSPGGRATCG